MLRSLFVLLLCLPGTAVGISLFGVDLTTENLQAFRAAVKNTGAQLKQEAGKDQFFDRYDASRLLPDARQFYFGFVKQDGRFAFAEYEFPGLKHPDLLVKLKQKYGEPTVRKARFISDIEYQWQIDGINIRLYQDWPMYATRLVYSEKAALQSLQQEKLAFDKALQEQQREYPPDFY